MKTRMQLFSVFFVLIVVVLIGVGSANVEAMPMFARKYNTPCDTCHITIPVLNETGYKFRAAGFRFPEMLGKSDPKAFELGDYFSARIQPRYDLQITNQPNGAPAPNLLSNGAPGPRTSTNDFSFSELTLYPLTGSWGKYFGSMVEASFSPEDFMEVENAYARVVFGKAACAGANCKVDRLLTIRAGVFHPWEGFGASDRPFSNARTLFQTAPQSAKGTAIPYLFQPWGLDEAGIEVGVDIKRLSLRAALLGGTIIRWDEEAQTFLAFPAQTGPWKGANQAVAALGKPVTSVAHSTPDFSMNATYILHKDGGGISLLYYRGNVSTPTSCTDGTLLGKNHPETTTPCGGADTDFSNPSTLFRNNFDRMSAYASYPVGKHFLPMAGFDYGRDTNSNLTKFDSKGAFVDGVFFLNRYVTSGLRYDWYHPNMVKLNTQWAITPYVNIPLWNGAQVITEYSHRDFRLDATNHRQNDTLQIRIIFIK